MKKNQSQLVALVGRPNVGKSALFNRIIKKNKAIVDPTRGVTRDRAYDKVVWQDREFILVDTGGIEGAPELVNDPRGHVTDGAIMAGLIKEQTWQAIEEADIIVFVLDGREGLLTDDYEVLQALRRTEKPLYYAVNKIDNQVAEEKFLPTFYELGVPTLWPVSALHGYGVPDFLDELVGKLVPLAEPSPVPPDTIGVACIGRPNVGKSSLVNRLLGEERMVVSDIAGTTRDSVDTLFVNNGRHYLLIDTAGIRRKGKVSEKLEKFSVMRALAAIEKSDCVMVLLDAKEGITEQDTKIIGYGLEQGRACLILINKWDLVTNDLKRQKYMLEEIERATAFIGYAPTLKISALRGAGVKKIFPAVENLYRQFSLEFTTNKLNRVLQKAVEGHSPSLHKGHRIKFYYVTQVGTKPPTFIIFVNYPKAVHFSYYRYLVNQFREQLGLDQTSLRIILKERVREKYE